MNEIFGIFPMIVGSIYVTAGAIIVGVPIGILCAVFMARFCPKKLYPILKPAIELMAGIPSIVYGFFGLVVIVPIIQQSDRNQWKRSTDSIHSSGNHDSADDHRSIRECDPGSAGKLLRRSTGTGRYP